MCVCVGVGAGRAGGFVVSRHCDQRGLCQGDTHSHCMCMLFLASLTSGVWCCVLRQSLAGMSILRGSDLKKYGDFNLTRINESDFSRTQRLEQSKQAKQQAAAVPTRSSPAGASSEAKSESETAPTTAASAVETAAPAAVETADTPAPAAKRPRRQQ